MAINIPVEAIIKSIESQSTDKQSTKQKESQVKEQQKSLEQQAAAKASDLEQDAKAKTDAINKELGQIPQKIEEVEDQAISTLKEALGAEPTVKKIKVKTADGFEYNKPDFDADKVLKKIEELISPVTTIASTLDIGDSIPVLGDLTSLLTKVSSDKSGESELSEEELYKLMPNPPDIPKSVTDKAQTIVKLIGQALQTLPFLLFQVVGKMFSVVTDLFSQLGLSIPSPLSLVGDLINIATDATTLISQLPSQIEDILEQKLSKKFHYAAALSVPKPNLGASTNEVKKTATSQSTSNNKTESTTTKIEQSQTPPAASNIPDTPSVPEAKPQAPVKKLPKTCSFFNIEIISEWGEDDNKLDPTKTRVNPSDRDDDQTIIDYIDAIIKKYPNITKVRDHYEFNSLTKNMTRLQAFEYFYPIFSKFWKRKETLKNVNGHIVNLTRDVDVSVYETPKQPWTVKVTYFQIGYEDLKDKYGDIYESDEEFKFPDGFLTV